MNNLTKLACPACKAVTFDVPSDGMRCLNDRCGKVWSAREWVEAGKESKHKRPMWVAARVMSARRHNAHNTAQAPGYDYSSLAVLAALPNSDSKSFL